MSTPANGEIHSSADDAENARVGYQVALDFAAFYGGAIWSMFNAMLVANSIVVAGTVVVLSGQSSLAILKTFLSVVGLLLCVTWFLLVKRSHEYSAYYVLSAREIEEKYLSPQITTLSRGGVYGGGKAVSLHIGGALTSQRMSPWARWVKSEFLSYVVILIFAALYLMLFFKF
jgi:hypothetical protein